MLEFSSLLRGGYGWTKVLVAQENGTGVKVPTFPPRNHLHILLNSHDVLLEMTSNHKYLKSTVVRVSFADRPFSLQQWTLPCRRLK